MAEVVSGRKKVTILPTLCADGCPALRVTIFDDNNPLNWITYDRAHSVSFDTETGRMEIEYGAERYGLEVWGSKIE